MVFAPSGGRLLALAWLVACSSGAAAAPAALPAITEPSGVLSLSQAVALALTGNPELAAFAWQLRAAEAHSLQAGLRPNPRLELEVEDLAASGSYHGARRSQTTLRLSQLVELGGKRDARGQVADAARARTSDLYEARRVAVLATVAERFVSVLAGQQRLTLTESHVRLCESALAATRQRMRAGKASALDESKADIALARSRIEFEHATHQLLVARSDLAATWAAETPTFERADGDLFEVTEAPSFVKLLERLPRSPELTLVAAERRLRTAELALARAHPIPDITATIGARRLEGPDATTMVAQLSLPLPISDRNQGAIAQAQAAERETETDEHGVTVRLRATLFGLYQELQHAGVAIESLRRVVLPRAAAALELSQQGYRSGRFSYLDLLDAQHTLFEVRVEAIDTAVTYHHVLLAIERLLGQPIDASPVQP